MFKIKLLIKLKMKKFFFKDSDSLVEKTLENWGFYSIPYKDFWI